MLRKYLIGFVIFAAIYALAVGVLLILSTGKAEDRSVAVSRPTTDVAGDTAAEPKAAESTQELLVKSYDSLYGSRRYFDDGIKGLHDASADLDFLSYPDRETADYVSHEKESSTGKIVESVLDLDPYRVRISSSEDGSSTFTRVALTSGGKTMKSREYKGVSFHQMYGVRVGKTSYYLLGLCSGGTHGCGTLVLIVRDGNGVVFGPPVTSVDFSDFIGRDNFFTKGGEPYVVLDDVRYFSNYSASNNASYNSAVPRIYRMEKSTGKIIPASGGYLDLYRKSAEMILVDLKTLRDSLPSDGREAVMQSSIGLSLAPYFDYCLGMAILSDVSHAAIARAEVKQLYYELYGKSAPPEAHFDGYGDFEK